MTRLRAYSFFITVHDNGELRVKLSGCRGAEYYDSVDSVLGRIKEFTKLECGIYVNLLFTRNDQKTGFYLPKNSVLEEWFAVFSTVSTYPCKAEIANKRTSDGEFSVPSFYTERDLGAIGFRPVAKHQISTQVPYELSHGFDVTNNNSLYKGEIYRDD